VEQLEVDFVPLAGNGSLGSPQSMERAILIEEITQLLELCVAGPDQERNTRIFWLHYRSGLSARAIADLPGILLTTKGVESIILRITRELRTRMAEPKGGAAAESQSPGEGFWSAQSF